MTQPNPNIPPAAANVSPVAQGPEAVPFPNQTMTEEQWASDQVQLGSLLTELSDTSRREANIQRFLDKGMIDNAQAQAERLQVQAARQGIGTGIGNLAQRSDTSAILSKLEDASHNISQANTRANQAVNGPEGTILKASRARHNANVTQATYNNTSTYIGAHPINSGGDLADRMRKLRAKRLKDLNYAVRRDGEGAGQAGMAGTARERSIYTLENTQGFDTQVAGLAHNLRQQHEAARINAENLTEELLDELSTWDISRGSTEAYQGQEQYVRRRMEDLSGVINGLSRHDLLRAQAQGEYTRLRYRLEARGVNADASNGNYNGERYYEPDQGIHLYNGQGDRETIIYADGTTARAEGPNGEFVRRSPSGKEWEAIDNNTTELGIGDAPLAGPLRDIFNRWEENRTPAATAEAHASLSSFVDREGQREVAIVNGIADLTVQIPAQDTLVKTHNQQQQSAVQRVQAVQAAIGTGNPTPDQAQQLNDANVALHNADQALAAAEAQLRQMQTARRRAEAELPRMREGLNSARYWQAHMEVSAERIVTPNAVQARFLVRRAVRQAQNALPPAPVLLRDGSLQIAGATINHIRSDSWRIWPDGTTSHPTPRNTQRYYGPDGRFLGER